MFNRIGIIFTKNNHAIILFKGVLSWIHREKCLLLGIYIFKYIFLPVKPYTGVYSGEYSLRETNPECPWLKLIIEYRINLNTTDMKTKKHNM
jgi:hypothetical protein